MARINVHNTTRMPIYVGSTMIPPGDSRDFDEHDVPEHLKPAPVPPAPPAEEEKPDQPASKLAELRAKSVEVIKAALVTLTEEELIALEAAESADETPRKTLLEAVTAERLRRAGDAK